MDEVLIRAKDARLYPCRNVEKFGKTVDFDTASATLEGIEVAHMIRKGQRGPRLCPFARFSALAA